MSGDLENWLCDEKHPHIGVSEIFRGNAVQKHTLSKKVLRKKGYFETFVSPYSLILYEEDTRIVKSELNKSMKVFF